jgi:predicted RNase H-like nuclease (RuvC/YqgF family)
MGDQAAAKNDGPANAPQHEGERPDHKEAVAQVVQMLGMMTHAGDRIRQLHAKHQELHATNERLRAENEALRAENDSLKRTVAPVTGGKTVITKTTTTTTTTTTMTTTTTPAPASAPKRRSRK